MNENDRADQLDSLLEQLNHLITGNQPHKTLVVAHLDVEALLAHLRVLSGRVETGRTQLATMTANRDALAATETGLRADLAGRQAALEECQRRFNATQEALATELTKERGLGTMVNGLIRYPVPRERTEFVAATFTALTLKEVGQALDTQDQRIRQLVAERDQLVKERETVAGEYLKRVAERDESRVTERDACFEVVRQADVCDECRDQLEADLSVDGTARDASLCSAHRELVPGCPRCFPDGLSAPQEVVLTGDFEESTVDCDGGDCGHPCDRCGAAYGKHGVPDCDGAMRCVCHDEPSLSAAESQTLVELRRQLLEARDHLTVVVDPGQVVSIAGVTSRWIEVKVRVDPAPLPYKTP